MENTNRRFTLEIQLNPNSLIRYHNLPKLKIVIMMLCMSTFYFGYSLAYVSTLSPQTMINVFGPLTQQSIIQGLVIAILTIGAAIGAFCSTFFMKCLSRRNLILAINLAAIVIEGIIQYGNIYCLLVCRAIQGFFIGNFMAIVPIYINELCPKQKVGGFGVYTQLFVTFGVLFAYIMGTILTKAGVPGQTMWRIMFILNMIPIITVIVGISLKIIPESPNSLIINDNVQQAKQVIGMFHKPQFIETVLKQKMLEVEHELNTHKQEKGLSYGKLAYFLGFELPFMQQLTGINAIVTQIGAVVTQHNPSFGYYTPLVLNGTQTIATFFAILAINNHGRKPIILSGNLLLGAFDITMGILFLFIQDSNAIFWVVFAILILYNIVYGVTLGPTVWLFVPEIIPAKIVPFATTLNWIGCSIAILILPVLNEKLGDEAVFFLFGAVTLVLFIVNAIFIKETKGKTLDQVCSIYSGSNNAKSN